MSKGTISGRVDAIKYVLLGALAQSGDVLDGEQLSSFKDQAAKSGSSNSATHYTKACRQELATRTASRGPGLRQPLIECAL